jgi:DNA-binding response OmpR family regulator
MENGKKVVIVIDDDPDFREALELILGASGFMMKQAGSCQEGLELCKESEPDFIMVDLMMEEEDSGVQFIKQYRTEDYQTPIFLLSGIGSADEHMQHGFTGVMQKPVNHMELVSTIKKHLN